MLGKNGKFAGFVLCLCLLGGCAYKPASAVSYTLISEKEDNTNRYYVQTGQPVQGKDCLTTFFYYGVWVGTPPVEETLLAKVLEENNADALIDAEFRQSYGFFPLIFTRTCLTVSGIPVKLKGVP